ncbi:MAG: ABC transporter ATP-binding protein [Planctomycetota bacterium]
MGAFTLRGVTKRFGEVSALDGFDLDARDGEILALLGPSGSGKTTALRVLAGLERPDAGEAYLGDRLVAGPGLHVPPEDRGLGMVFQGLALWPHMTARGHLEFCLRGRGVPRGAWDAPIREALARAHLDVPETRYPHELSGGQAQRLAIARAIVAEPRVVLLDEPLANLDAPLKEELITELRELRRDIGATFLHVTHDQREALSIADRVAVIRNGRVEQVGTPDEVYDRPRTAFVAQFVGQGTLLPARVEGGRAVTCLGPVDVGPLDGASELLVAVRPEQVAEDPSGVVAAVEDGVYHGGQWTWRLSVAGTTVLMRSKESPTRGAQVRVSARKGIAFPKED